VADDDLLAVWCWDSEADWEAGFAKLMPQLQEYVIPNLAGPPERVGGEVLIEIEA
jgi:hypothetical protein